MVNKQNIPAKLILEDWLYSSNFGTGGERGIRACLYSPSERSAILLETRDRIFGAQDSKWIPSDPDDHYYDEEKRDLKLKEITKFSSSLEGQIRIFEDSRNKSSSCYSYTNFRVEDISLSGEELEMLRSYEPEFTPIFEVNSKLVDWLSEKMNRKN